jgi:hypothetical protein
MNMSNTSLAESILSRFTTPDRAASIIGDLTDNAASSNVVWFWWSVLQTAFWLFGQSLRTNPVRVARRVFLWALQLLVFSFLWHRLMDYSWFWSVGINLWIDVLPRMRRGYKSLQQRPRL